MNFALSSEHQALKETVRKFLRKECPPEKVRALDERDEFPAGILEKMKPLGLSGLTIDEKHGGSGVDILGAILVVEELSARFPALAWIYVMSAFYGGVNVGRNGSEMQKERFLPGLAGGNILFSYALTEPDTGSDAASARTALTRRGEELLA